MEPLEFLGGKYHQPEQMVPGVVETFKAREKSSGRAVFVHRVSTAEDDSQQAAVLRLLLQALYRSPSAKELVLDYTQDGNYFYVVTQNVPQCMLLKEWLQFEIDHANVAESPKVEAVEPVKLESVKLEPVKPEPVATTPPGEFTRMFQAASPPRAEPVKPQPPPAPPEPKLEPSPTQTQPAAVGFGPSEFTRMFQTTAPEPVQAPPPPSPPPAKPEPLPAPPAAAGPGEFTRMFQANNVAGPAEPAKPQPASPAPPPKSEPAPSGPGEFTRFFSGGLPPSANQPAQPSNFQPKQDRPSNPGVQRPGSVQRPTHSPVPASAQRPTEPGEFTRMFSRAETPAQGGGPGPRKPEINDPFATPSSQMPGLSVSSAMPSAPAAQEPGEYTRMFGKGNLPSAAPQAPVVSQSAGPLFEDSALRAPGSASAPPAAPPVAKGPSEYTRVMQGLRPTGAPPASPSPLAATQAPGAAAPPSAAAPAPAPAAETGAKPAGAASNQKLIIFLAVLGVVTVILILVVVLIAMKK